MGQPLDFEMHPAVRCRDRFCRLTFETESASNLCIFSDAVRNVRFESAGGVGI